MRFGKHLNETEVKDKPDVKKPKSSDDDDSLEVERNDNHIYFYTEVTKSSVLELNKNLKLVGGDLIHTAHILEIPIPDIKLHINSPGGSLFDGLAAVDAVRKSKAPVHSIIEGSAASAATLISVMAHKRTINKHSYMLIHQLSSGMYGKYEELLDDMENSKVLMEMVKKIYLDRTKIPAKMLNEILKKDLYFDANQCLKYGLVDDIIE